MTAQTVARVGTNVEVSSHAVGEHARTGKVLEVLGSATHPHYLVEWEDGHVSTLYPGSDVRFVEPSTPT